MYSSLPKNYFFSSKPYLGFKGININTKSGLPSNAVETKFSNTKTPPLTKEIIEWILKPSVPNIIPSEPIGGLPKPPSLINSYKSYLSGNLAMHELESDIISSALNTMEDQARMGEKMLICDGEYGKMNLISYPFIEWKSNAMMKFYYQLDRFIEVPVIDNVTYSYKKQKTITSHTRSYIRTSSKQTFVAPSSLSLLYTKQHLDTFPKKNFIRDIIDKTESDIREHLSEISKVQINFVEPGWLLRMDPSGLKLREHIDINNMLFKRFESNEKRKLGVYTYFWDKNSYLQYLPLILNVLEVNNFYLPFASYDEETQISILKTIKEHSKPHHKIFLGVITHGTKVETPNDIANKILEATKYINVESLGTTDDYNFSPYLSASEVPYPVALLKTRARIQGTKLAKKALRFAIGIEGL